MGFAIGALVLSLLFAPGISFERWWPALVVVALFVTAVELLRREIGREHPDARAHTEA